MLSYHSILNIYNHIRTRWRCRDDCNHSPNTHKGSLDSSVVAIMTTAQTLKRPSWTGLPEPLISIKLKEIKSERSFLDHHSHGLRVAGLVHVLHKPFCILTVTVITTVLLHALRSRLSSTTRVIVGWSRISAARTCTAHGRLRIDFYQEYWTLWFAQKPAMLQWLTQHLNKIPRFRNIRAKATILQRRWFWNE